jgi:hypothetical protein
VGQRGQRLPPLRPATPRLPITERCRSQRITPPKQPFSNPVKRQSTRRDRSPQSPRKTLPPNRQHNPTLSKTRPKTTLTINGPHTTPNPTQPAPDTHQPSAHWLSTRATPHPSRTAPNPSHPPSPEIPRLRTKPPANRPKQAPTRPGPLSEPPKPTPPRRRCPQAEPTPRPRPTTSWLPIRATRSGPKPSTPNSTQPAAPLAMRDPAAGATMCA